MDKVIPAYSRKAVNRAGQALQDDIDDIEKWLLAYDILSNWRSAHAYPVNTFQATLRNRVRDIDPNAIVAQRLKRTPSILKKLRRFPDMQLARMQDIGGLRAVVKDLDAVDTLAESYVGRQGALKHRLLRVDDYIQCPKDSGYRSVHLTFQYQNSIAPEFNGLRLEIQIRTLLQHSWATAVETAGTFLKSSFKTNEGAQEWLDFFSLVGAGFSILEECPVNERYAELSHIEILKLIKKEAARLKVEKILAGYRKAFSIIDDGTKLKKREFYLITLNLEKFTLSIQSYGRRTLEYATEQYEELEKRIANGELLEAVLVSAGSVKDLRRAYPNYFSDTRFFLRNLRKLIDKV